MEAKKKKFFPKIPDLDLSDGSDMLTDFSREAQRHLISARNSLLVLETVQNDKEAIENIFKTFHTIKGLADFLHLSDICSLTSEAEEMLDMARKDILNFEEGLASLAARTINSLQKLLELLDEQISNHGTLKSAYLDVGQLIIAMQNLKIKKSLTPDSSKPAQKAIPSIHFEPDMSACTLLEQKIKGAAGDIPIEADLLQKMISDFQKTGKELKESQSKVHERQRELIKERELAIKLTEQAQSEARAKSEYLANMSHEIRTLINAILGFTELLRGGALNNKQKEHLSTIILSGKMLLEIVNDILDFSKVEAGKLKLEKIDFHLERIVEDVFKIIRTRLTSKSIHLFFQIKDDVPCQLLGDPTRLKQIFINLLDNAIKFTEEGEIGLVVSKEQEKRTMDGQYVLRFVIQDTGIGIPEDRQKEIFESFTQADESTTRLYGGSGLGLALCKTLIETMGGGIWVDSTLGKGSEFVFTLKFKEGKFEGKSNDHDVIPELVGTEMMIVDGHKNVSDSLISLGEKMRLKILHRAQGAKQATELLLRREEEDKTLPAIIFIDTMLPNKEGFMLAYKIRQQARYKGIKLVAVSSDVKTDSSSDYHQAGFDLFLPKPIISSEVKDVLSQLLIDQKADRRMIPENMLDQISCEGVRVLVAEDSIPNQELLKVHFESLGCHCDYVSNGQEAIDKLKQTNYDICFMDLQMPVVGGIDAAAFIRQELKNDLPIVALTAAEIDEEKERCFRAGMTDYLSKPFEMKELKEKLIKCVKI